MDHSDRISCFQSEAAAFEKAVRRALDPGEPEPAVPSCPGWSVSDLVVHLGESTATSRTSCASGSPPRRTPPASPSRSRRPTRKA